jgi:hypothetical protein
VACIHDSGAKLLVNIIRVNLRCLSQLGQSNIERRNQRKELRETRYAIAPLLQAEEDLRYVEARRAGLIDPSCYNDPNMWALPAK